MTPQAEGSYFGTQHLEQTTLSYMHFIENPQAKPGQHYWKLLLKIWDMLLVLLKVSNFWKVVLLEGILTNQNFEAKNPGMFPSSLLWMLRKTELMNLGVDSFLQRQARLEHIVIQLIGLAVLLMLQKSKLEVGNQRHLVNMCLNK